MNEQITVGAGVVVHIQGIPFRLTAPAEMEGHPNNVRMVFGDAPPFINVANLNPSPWRRLVLWFRALFR